MAIIVNLDVMLAKRKMSLTELSEKVDITISNLSILKNRQGEGDPVLYTRGDLRSTRLPAGGYS